MKSMIKYVLMMVMAAGMMTAWAQNEIQIPDDPAATLPTDPDVIYGTLDNGIRYYIRHNETPKNRAELRIVTNAGSVVEDDDQLGLAHLCEHMAFNGTENFPKHKLVNFLESIGMRFGAELNAYTSFDETVYFLQIPLDNPAYMDTGFMILSDWAHNVSFDNDEIDKERGVVVEEWRLGRGAQDRMMRKYFPVMFHGSHYAERMVIGDTNILLHSPHDAVKRFYHDWYRPDLQAVIAVGDFDVDSVKDYIVKYFSPIPASKNPRERIMYKVPDHDETLVSIVSDKENPYSQLLYFIKRDKDTEVNHGTYRTGIVESLFSSMLTSRLQEKMQDENPPFMFAMGQSSPIVRTKDAFMLVAIPKNNEVERSLQVLMEEVRRVKLHGFTKTELERQKVEILRGIEKSYKEKDKQKSTRYASEYQRNFLVNESFPGITYEKALYEKYMPTISIEEVNAMIDKMIMTKNNVIVVTLPEKEGVNTVTEKGLLKVIKKVNKEKDIAPYIDNYSNKPLISELPAAGTVTDKKDITEIDAQEWTLSNGVRVILKKTDFKNDEIRMRAFSPGGYSLYGAEDDVSAKYADAVINRSGIGEFDNIELEKKLAGKIVSVSPYIGELSEGISGNTSPDDLETFFQLVHLYFTQPRKDLKAYGNFISEQRNSLENKSASPRAAFSDTIATTLSNYHPRKMPLTLDKLKEADIERMMAIYQERFANAGEFTFVFVGNFEYDKIQPMIEKYLGSLPATDDRENWKNLGVKTPENSIEKTIYRGMEDKATVFLAFEGLGDYKYNPETRLDLDAMIRILNIRLRENIREEQSGVYSISSWASQHKYPEDGYFVGVYFGCAPANVDKLVNSVYDEIRKLQEEGSTETNLNKIKETLLRSNEVNQRENNYWLRTIYSHYYNQEDFTNIPGYEDKIKALDNDVIKATAHKYIDLNKVIRIVMLPEKMKP